MKGRKEGDMIELLIAGIITYGLAGCCLAGKKLFGGLNTPTVKEPDDEEPVILDVVLPKGFSIVESYYTNRYEKYMICLKNSTGETYWFGAQSKEQAEQDALWICKNNPALKY